MNTLLNSPNLSFYHLTVASRISGIMSEGLKNMNGKGISVVRTNDFRIINSLIVNQLYSPEVEQENHFVLLKIPQNLNRFTIYDVKPDIVTDWTWPLHNNIVNLTIPFSKIEIDFQFSVSDWQGINHDDPKNQKYIQQTQLYVDGLGLQYLKKGNLIRADQWYDELLNLY